MPQTVPCNYLDDVERLCRLAPETVTFENGCSASFDDDIVWVSNPYGVDSAIDRGAECPHRLFNYLRYWSEDRDERGSIVTTAGEQ